jgi:hypothetical protein
MGKLNKQFPSKEMYIQAFATWSAIKQAYNPDPSFSAALFMHINTMLTLTANLEWPKVLRYELLFFRTHQTSKSTTGRVSAGSMSIGPICILHDEDTLNVGGQDPYIPEWQSH